MNLANYVYVKEPGILLDALFLLKMRFNGEKAYSKFRSESDFDEREEKYLELMQSQTVNISDRLLPLFYYDPEAGLKTPLIWYMRDNWELLMNNPAEIINGFIDLLKDMPKLKEYIFVHYFPLKSVPAFKSMEYIRETILASEYPINLKLYLMDFFVSSDREVSFIIEEFKKALNIALDVWKENHIIIDESNLQFVNQNIDAILNDKNVSLENYSDFYYSYCYVLRRTMYVEAFNNSNILVYLGSKKDLSNQGLINPKETINFYEIGRCLYDETRLAIITMLRKGEMYCAEIARELGLKNNSTIYHLNMMHQQNILKTRSQGKKIFYSLNIKFFIFVNQYLREIIEEENIREDELEKAKD